MAQRTPLGQPGSTAAGSAAGVGARDVAQDLFGWPSPAAGTEGDHDQQGGGGVVGYRTSTEAHMRYATRPIAERSDHRRTPEPDAM